MLDNPGKPLVSVRDLKMHFPIYSGLLRRRVGEVKAVDGLTFDVMEGETLGLVGESGCGKSTAGRAVLRLYDITGGQIAIDGREIGDTPQSQLREMRPTMQMVFQDPYTALNPRLTVLHALVEPLLYHQPQLKRQNAIDQAMAQLLAVGSDAALAQRCPHQLSGGQRQRINIARALMVQPEFIVADEPLSALDVSIQAQILNLLAELQHQQQLTYLIFSHNLAAVEHMADRVAVMYRGVIVETGDVAQILGAPKHEYTRSLIAAVPRADTKLERFTSVDYIEGTTNNFKRIDIQNHWLGETLSPILI